jgi:transcriptional regulator with XRE-family HTH domain
MLPSRGPIGKSKAAHPEIYPGFRLSQYLKELIRQKGFTALQVAERTGVSLAGINHLLSGRVEMPSSETIRNLARALGVTSLDILTHTSATSEDDVRRFVLSQTMSGDDLTSDSTWNLIANRISQLPPGQRDILKSVFLALVQSHQGFCEAAD